MASSKWTTAWYPRGCNTGVSSHPLLLRTSPCNRLTGTPAWTAVGHTSPGFGDPSAQRKPSVSAETGWCWPLSLPEVPHLDGIGGLAAYRPS